MIPSVIVLVVMVPVVITGVLVAIVVDNGGVVEIETLVVVVKLIRVVLGVVIVVVAIVTVVDNEGGVEICDNASLLPFKMLIVKIPNRRPMIHNTTQKTTLKLLCVSSETFKSVLTLGDIALACTAAN